MTKIRIAVVDDHRLIREMWTNLFSDHDNIDLVGESGEFDLAIEMIKFQKPDIVLLDINLSKASGMDALPLIKECCPDTKVIAVSMHTQPIYAKKMFRLGARGYVTKNSPSQEIFDAISEVMKGNIYICSELKNIISEQVMTDAEETPDSSCLSNREIEIIKHIKVGESSNEIADKLNISYRTVQVHRHNILKKLKLKNTASLVNYVYKTDFNL